MAFLSKLLNWLRGEPRPSLQRKLDELDRVIEEDRRTLEWVRRHRDG